PSFMTNSARLSVRARRRAVRAVDRRYAGYSNLRLSIMRTLLLLLVVGLVAGWQTPLPPVDPHMAWVDFSTPSPGGKLLMAERLDNQRLNDGRFFQVTPGSHELRVRFDFEVFGGGGSLLTGPVERLCYLTIRYDHF